MAKATKKNNGAAEGSARGSDPEAPLNDMQVVDLPESFRQEFTADTYRAGQYTHDELGLSTDDLLAMYRNMLLQRRFEERAAQMYGKQKIAGFLHLYIGQEAVSTGAAWSMNVGRDSVITAYRDHGIALALGMDTNACMAELFGKIDGCSRGKGGSMHFFDAEKKMFGGHGIVGGHIPVGTGLAFSHKYKEEGAANICFFGDGAVGQGSFHEAINLAGLYDLPIIFVIENNQYAMGTAVHRAFSETDFYKQAQGYDIEAVVVNGMDVLTVYKAFADHMPRARKGQPFLFEIRTYRYRGHSMSDPAKYRTKEELEQKKNEDPIIRLKSYMVKAELATNEDFDAIDDEVKEEVLQSVEFAEQSPLPPLETIYDDVYTQKDYPFLS
ncbi:MAG: pyruvate dehydrogenase (acetyl-transferring) E1 component subunit alpha [Rhodothermales bacterium]